MMKLACVRAMGLAVRPRSDLDEAERLRLEDHLERCSRCAEEVALLDSAVGHLRSSAAPDAAMHARAFSRAWSKRDERTPPAAAADSAGVGRKLAAVAALAAAAAAALFFAFGADPDRRPSGSPPPTVAETAPPADSGLAGSIELAAGEELEIAGAIVVAIEPSAFELDPEATTVRIARGAMRFEVEPGRTIPFSVESDRVRVEVLGTVFEVDGDEVRVERGRVRASTPGGALGVVLEAGDQWSASEAERASSEPAAEPSPLASAPASAAAIDPRASLARARRHLASGEVPQARSLVQRALTMRLPPALDAEARTLLAECALVAGNPEEAARRYAEVARKHADTAAGETALFAAARAAHSSGQRDEARRLLSLYLSQYPQGQFVKEAQSRLAQLSQPTNGGR